MSAIGKSLPLSPTSGTPMVLFDLARPLRFTLLLACALVILAGCDSATTPSPSSADADGSSDLATANARNGNGGNVQDGIPPIFASALDLDIENRTVTLPLFEGEGPSGEAVYYILTETSDFKASVRGGVNWSPKMTNALGTAAVQEAVYLNPAGRRVPLQGDNVVNRLRLDNFTLRFSGTVDFSPERRVIPGPNGFPLDPASQPGSVGDAQYSPVFTTGDGLVYNAPHVANATGLHDDVLAIDYDAMTVTLEMVAGFYEEDFVLYLSTEASVDDIAALESGTFAPNLNAAPSAGDRDPETSSREAIIPIVNGATGIDNPERQGLRSAVAGEGDPLNIFREEPECGDPDDCSALLYSPLWDVHPVVWTEDAIASGQQRRLTTHVDVIQLFQDGLLVSGAPSGVVNEGLGGLRAAGVIVNCPNIFQRVGEDDGEEE